MQGLRFLKNPVGIEVYKSYDSHSEFKGKFYRQRQIKVNEHSIFNTSQQQLVSEIKESKTKIPTLSPVARLLLKETNKGPHGIILYVRFIGGTAIQANGNNVIPTNDQAEVARWEKALGELKDKELIVARGEKA